ncbi:hypothetical protein HanRHA438_Chr05g0207921 [Helianthus annuus]|nr:hypothetical protein HanIR_Chr05g0214021 [Helianthus annuus]KAJ0917609.1 hypothetical protein HanRHA438_Chr05g0207921 [Helianthus annuus]
MAARRSPSLGRAIRRLFDTKAHSLIPFRLVLHHTLLYPLMYVAVFSLLSPSLVVRMMLVCFIDVAYGL